MAPTPPKPLNEADRRRERAVLALGARDDHVGVIRLCEAWSKVAAVSPAARVVEGRALLHLCLVDRALSRAREVVETSPSDRPALRLLAEAYIERGWPLRARQVLDSLRSAGESVESLAARAAEEPSRPEAVARDIEAGNDRLALLGLAERFLSTGSSIRARGVLERLRAESPNSRVDALLWALAGDFSSPEPLESMVKRALPILADLSEVPEESEHTESISSDGGVQLEPEAAEVTFPTLFKRVATAGNPVPPMGPLLLASEADEDERTASSDVAAPPPLAANLTGARDSDTQILSVVGDGPGAGPLHHRKDGAPTIQNLRDWQASMGVDPLGSDLDGVDLPEEDSAVARKPNLGELPLVEAADLPAPIPEPTRTFAAPIEVIERHPTPVNDPPTLDPRAYESERQGWGAGLGRPLLGLVVVAGLALVVLLALGLAARAAGFLDVVNPSVNLNEVLSEADYSALVDAESRLAAEARTPSDRAALAQARVVLWSEYNGDPALLQPVDALLAAPEGVEVHQLAYLRAAELLAFRNPASALAAIGREPPANDEERLLLARAKAAMGDVEGALFELGQLASPNTPRNRLAKVAILRNAGRDQEARALVTIQAMGAPNHIATRLLELQLRTGSPGERAAAADVFRKTYGTLGLSPRQFGDAAWVEASAWNEAGDGERARTAAEQGLARDGTHRDILLFLATADLLDGELVDAARRLQRVHELYRSDPDIRTALFLVYCEIDRIDEARALAAGANPPLKLVLEAYVAGWAPVEGLPDASTIPTETALGAWAQGQVAAAGQRADAALLADAAAKALAAEKNPYIQRLAHRAETLAASLMEAPRAAARMAELRRRGIGDAAAHVYLGRYYEATQQRALAAQHFDRAAELEPELGLALYERGRFYADAHDNQGRTAQSWSAYLAQAPTGPRAERVKTSPLLRAK